MPVPWLREARLAGWVAYCSTVYARRQCREPKTGQEKVQLYCEDDTLFLSSYYLSMVATFECARLVSIFTIYCYVNVIYKFWKPLPVTGSGKILANSSSLGSHLCNDLKKKKQLWECVYYLWKSHFGLIMTQPTTYTRTLLVSLEHQNGPGHNILNNKEKGGIGSMFLSLAK